MTPETPLSVPKRNTARLRSLRSANSVLIAIHATDSDKFPMGGLTGNAGVRQSKIGRAWWRLCFGSMVNSRRLRTFCNGSGCFPIVGLFNQAAHSFEPPIGTARTPPISRPIHRTILQTQFQLAINHKPPLCPHDYGHPETSKVGKRHATAPARMRSYTSLISRIKFAHIQRFFKLRGASHLNFSRTALRYKV